MVRRGLALVGLWLAAVFVSSCGMIAGLGDYELAGDASVADAPGDRATGDVASGEGDGDGGVTGDATGEAADGAADASNPGDSGAVEAGADAPDTGLTVPPSDKDHVPCGTDTCDLPLEACCEEPDGSTCQPAQNSCDNGVIARCDEAANCISGQVCCVTDTSPGGLETQCKQSCSGGNPQSCRTDGECGGSGPCEAWLCAGTVVATCGAAGASAGCH